MCHTAILRQRQNRFFSSNSNSWLPTRPDMPRKSQTPQNTLKEGYQWSTIRNGKAGKGWKSWVSMPWPWHETVRDLHYTKWSHLAEIHEGILTDDRQCSGHACQCSASALAKLAWFHLLAKGSLMCAREVCTCTFYCLLDPKSKTGAEELSRG